MHGGGTYAWMPACLHACALWCPYCRKRVAYEKDARREKAIAAQQEVEGLQRKRVALERQLAAQR